MNKKLLLILVALLLMPSVNYAMMGDGYLGSLLYESPQAIEEADNFTSYPSGFETSQANVFYDERTMMEYVVDGFEKGETEVSVVFNGAYNKERITEAFSIASIRKMSSYLFYGMNYVYSLHDNLYNAIFYPGFEDRNIGVQTMEDRRFAIEEVRNIIDKAKLRSLNDFEKIRRVHDIIVLSYDYDQTYSVSFPYEMMRKGKGVCQAYTLLFEIFMNELGIENGIISGEHRGEGHSWNVVRLNGTWYNVDTTHDDPIFPDIVRPDYVRYLYFLVEDNNPDMASERTWDKDCPKLANGGDYPTNLTEKTYTTKEREDLFNGVDIDAPIDPPIVEPPIGEKISESELNKIFSGIELPTQVKTPNHIWTIRLNGKVDERSLLENNIFAVNLQTSEKVPVDCALTDDGEGILVKAKSPYKTDVEYVLVVRNLRSTNLSPMTKTYYMPFEVK